MTKQMTEVARALVLPDLRPPSREDLLALLLVWDALDVELTYSNIHAEPEILGIDRLEEEGLVRVRKMSFDPKSPPSKAKPYNDDLWKYFAKVYDADAVRQMAHDIGLKFAEQQIDLVRAGLRRASDTGVAPVAVTPHAAKAACLPPLDETTAVTESALVSTAVRDVKVDPGTDVEEVLAFRSKHSALMGRFRAALVDLSQSITAESPTAATEQAYAVVQNRVEPALADLDSALAQSRIGYAWKTLMGATTLVVSAPLGPAGALAKGGSVAVQPVRYAFNRDRLVREHPFGLLYRAREQFGERHVTHPPIPITNPADELRSMFYELVRIGCEVSIEAVGGLSSERVTSAEVTAVLGLPDELATVVADILNEQKPDEGDGDEQR